MSKRQNLLAVWQQIPVANRTVGAAASVTVVSDKTGYSLTAGSYSVRASATQRGTIALVSTSSNTASISSVTTNRASLDPLGQWVDGNTTDPRDYLATVALSSGTVVTATRGGASATYALTAGFNVIEFF